MLLDWSINFILLLKDEKLFLKLDYTSFEVFDSFFNFFESSRCIVFLVLTFNKWIAIVISLRLFLYFLVCILKRIIMILKCHFRLILLFLLLLYNSIDSIGFRFFLFPFLLLLFHQQLLILRFHILQPWHQSPKFVLIARRINRVSNHLPPPFALIKLKWVSQHTKVRHFTVEILKYLFQIDTRAVRFDWLDGDSRVFKFDDDAIIEGVDHLINVGRVVDIDRLT